MIRTTLFGISVLALSAGSAFAAPKHPVAKTPVVAQADTAAPSGDAAKPAKKSSKKSTKDSSKKAKGDDAAKTEGGSKEMKGTAPSAPATK